MVSTQPACSAAHNTPAEYLRFVTVQFERSTLQRKSNDIQKQVTARFKVSSMRGREQAREKARAHLPVLLQAKEPADELKAEKVAVDKEVAAYAERTREAEEALRKKANRVGNLVHDSVPVSDNEDDNLVVRTYHPDGPNAQPVKGGPEVLSHHEVMYKLDITDMERGSKVAGHRGFFLVNDGIDLNQALIMHGLDFLRSKGYKKIMPPFFMNR